MNSFSLKFLKKMIGGPFVVTVIFMELYEEVKDIDIDAKKIDRTEKQRDTWETLAQAYRERNQEILPLGGI